MFNGIDHVLIVVADLPASIEHFSKLYGMPPTSVGEPGPEFQMAIFDMGDSYVELVSPTSADGPIARRLATGGEGIHLFALKVGDMDEALAHLRSQGVRLINDPGAGNPVKGQVFIHPKSAGGILTELRQR